MLPSIVHLKTSAHVMLLQTSSRSLQLPQISAFSQSRISLLCRFTCHRTRLARSAVFFQRSPSTDVLLSTVSVSATCAMAPFLLVNFRLLITSLRHSDLLALHSFNFNPITHSLLFNPLPLSTLLFNSLLQYIMKQQIGKWKREKHGVKLAEHDPLHEPLQPQTRRRHSLYQFLFERQRALPSETVPT